MSYVIFDQIKKFVCPCGCGKELKLSIQETKPSGWNAFVMDGNDFVVMVGEAYTGDE